MMSSPASATPSRLYRGVRQEPDGRWTAHVSEGDGEGRLIGNFRFETHAALAHDRVAVVLGGGARRRLNFPPSFNRMERFFLRSSSRWCTDKESVFRAVGDGFTYDVEYESFLRAEFEASLCGLAGEETARAVAEFAAEERERWERPDSQSDESKAHMFVMGHLNPVACTSWVERFHEGDPNRSFFSCREAHERKQAARRAAEQEAVAGADQPPAEEVGAPGDDQAIDREEEERPDSTPVGPRLVRTLRRSLKRWLPRTCFDQFDEETSKASRQRRTHRQFDDHEQVPLLKISGTCSLPS